MTQVTTSAGKEKLKVFQTVLSSPGMDDKCKFNLVLSRQNILLLCRLIEVGLMTDKNDTDDEIITAFPKQSLEELKSVHGDILAKGGLAEFYEKLKLLK
jgi:hypothetical protein